MAASLSIAHQVLPSAPVGARNPLPAVAAMPEPPYRASTRGLPDDIAANIAYGQVTSIHPYLLQDAYSRERTPAPMRLAVLENDHLRAEFALDLGGRIVRLFDKTTGRDLVYRNAMFQPANLALRNAWFSGGVEWNIGMRGHWPLTCDTLYAAEVTGADGEPVLRMWEYERIRGLIAQIDATLDAAVPALHVQVRVRNPHPVETGIYWWTNIAVAQTPGSRVFTAATHAYKTGYDGSLSRVDLTAEDVSFPASAPAAADWFHDLPDGEKPWIAAVEPDGSGLGHVSTARLKGRKLFVWGDTTGGRHWCDWLGGETGAYFEIQGGLATTQYEHLPMPAGATWEWQESFLPLHIDDPSGDWTEAGERVGTALRKAASAASDGPVRLAAAAGLAPERMLSNGSPWGALEQALSERLGMRFDGLPGVRFDADAGEDAAYWRGLLGLAAAASGDEAAAVDVDVAPPSYVAGPRWERLLAEAPSTWMTNYHRAVMAHARGDLSAAISGYQASVRQRRSAWALRGLGLALLATGDEDAGLGHLADARSLAPSVVPLARELGEALLATGRAADARGLVASLPADMRELGRFRVLAIRAALADGDREAAGRMLTDEFDVPDIREGELSMSDLWREAFPDCPVPERYDFTMK
ncbi:DUF5107 domain-containing protein [Microbacterium sp. YJN-G]|uniref:DUF5107 domain-containing protein n=1 Tax=Microbacterium sp. YJN-G TaxID=2763257 RepID=UPI001878D486|nr:DUF5107 domain-containing protein [Microbacterium sp. YJN-G]